MLCTNTSTIHQEYISYINESRARGGRCCPMIFRSITGLYYPILITPRPPHPPMKLYLALVFLLFSSCAAGSVVPSVSQVSALQLTLEQAIGSGSDRCNDRAFVAGCCRQGGGRQADQVLVRLHTPSLHACQHPGHPCTRANTLNCSNAPRHSPTASPRDVLPSSPHTGGSRGPRDPRVDCVPVDSY